MSNKYEKELAAIDAVIAAGKYKDDWESLAEYPAPEWYKKAKFGVFIHWGVYSVPAYFSEWYVRLMYYKQNPVYWHHSKKYGKDYPYRNFISQFTAPEFDAAEWISLIRESGAKFVMPVAEHHDGFKMYDSALSRWTSVKQAMGRDVIGELKKETEAEGLVFATSSHRAEHYWFVNGAATVGYPNEAVSEEYSDLYGPCVNVNKKNSLRTLLRQEKGIIPSKEWLEDWLVHSAELIDKYRPQSLFFDWWIMNHAFRPYVKKFLAYYFNRSAEWGKEVCVQYKSDAVMYNVGIFDRERGQLAGVSPYVWQSETSTAYNAWSYCTTNKYKKPCEIARVMADVVSKNGNFVLNIGPKADGTICDEEKKILAAMGKWTRRNSEAIWGASPYKFWGEGKKFSYGSFREKNRYCKRDVRYTYRPCHVYAFVLGYARDGVYRMKRLALSNDDFHFVVRGVKLLGSDERVEWKLNGKYLEIKCKTRFEDDMPLCFDINVD